MVAGTCKLSNVRSDQERAELFFYKNNRAVFSGKNMEIEASALSSLCFRTKRKQNKTKKLKQQLSKTKKTSSQISSS